MRVLLQRVQRGSVTVEGQVVGSVEQGYVALVGVSHADTRAEAELLARKTANLRVFEDEQGKMNRSILEAGGGVLVVSQFTLYADMRRGRRPSFIDAAQPDRAAPLVDHYAERLRAEGVGRVEMGVFGAMMTVEIVNDGPVTILLDTADLA
ncbi:MAG: D-aminoacyl-tRNA deacylase [Anaerolineae bacterium]|nr:D-aminoacyl-tRNA deacylase [Anaerolineae bacterium]NUQ04799.1 D-tyrosyl-tRNA(Tyr) deacylase [Anaerolineae bacterium]